MGRGAREGQQTTSFFLPVSSGNKKGPCFLSRGSEGPELSCLLFVWFLQASTYGNNMGFCTAPWSLDSQEWSHWEGGDCSPCDLDNLQFNAQQEEARSPQLRWQPQDALYRAWSLGGHLPTRWPPQPAPKDAGGGGGGGQEPGSRVALHRLCSISHCRGWAPSPLHPPSPRLHLSPFRRRYPGSLHRKGGAEPALVFVRAAAGKSSKISTCTAGDAYLYIQARKP